MNNVKIEYIGGRLTRPELDGVSLTKAGLTGLKLEHPQGGRPKLTLEANSDLPERNKYVMPAPEWMLEENTFCSDSASKKTGKHIRRVTYFWEQGKDENVLNAFVTGGLPVQGLILF